MLMMKVLLLGATGLLGHNVLQQLAASGHHVVALVRNRHALMLETPDTMVVEGSPTDQATLRQSASGCDAIVNCAGVTDMSLLHREDYMAVNATLCDNVVSTMEALGIRCLVHTSTANTIGYGSAGRPADESAPMQEPFTKSYYAESKLTGEQTVLAAAGRHADWHAVVVNPGYMLGPMDVKPSSGRMLLAAYRRPLMFAPRGGKAFVDVRDVAAAVVSALTRGANGSRYLAVNSHACLGIKELYQMQARTIGYRQRVVTLPDWLLLAAGAVGDGLRRVGVRTELSTRNVRQLLVREYYDNRRAVGDLMMPETDIEESIRHFHSWRHDHQTKNH